MLMYQGFAIKVFVCMETVMALVNILFSTLNLFWNKVKGPPRVPPLHHLPTPISFAPESPASCLCSDVSPASLPYSHLCSVPCHLQTWKRGPWTRDAPCCHVTSGCGDQPGREALCGLPLLGRSLVPRAERPWQGTRSGLWVQPWPLLAVQPGLVTEHLRSSGPWRLVSLGWWVRQSGHECRLHRAVETVKHVKL